MPRKSPSHVTGPKATQFLEPTKFNKSFVPFGDRLDFLSDERQHLNTGKLRILPPLGLKKPFSEETS